jgi:DNA invertase Pin-like site-specific DNA recombinase
LFFHFLAAFSEYERELILDRSAAGRAFAKNMGVVFGRKTKPFPMKEINRDLALGIPKVIIAQKNSMAVSTFHRKYKAYSNTLNGKIKKFISEQEEETAVI